MSEGIMFDSGIAEFLAVIAGMSYLPNGWYGTIYSDSVIALGRVFDNYSVKTVPISILIEFEEQKKRLAWDRVHGKVMKGHPSKKEIEAGHTSDGRPAFIYAKDCDRLAKQEAQNYMRGFYANCKPE